MVAEENMTAVEGNGSTTDIWVETYGGQRIPAHYSVLAAASPVLANILDRLSRRRKPKNVIRILGVPHGAVLAFVGFLCSTTRDVLNHEQRKSIDEYAVHLLVLSHGYQVQWLKSQCEKHLVSRLTIESVVDMLQLAKHCDAPILHLGCMKLVHKDFASLEKTEGWIFLQNNDPWLELEILQSLHEIDLRQKRRRRKVEEQRVYIQLSEAMDCLQHICADGCIDMSPHKGREAPNMHKDSSFPCNKTCHALQLLINHLASCRTNRIACPHCRRLWNLLRLHSFVCDLPNQCRVPLCRQFKLKMEQMEGKTDDSKWKLLAKKLVSIQVMSSLVKRRRHDLLDKQ